MFLECQLPHSRRGLVYDNKPESTRLWGWGVGMEEISLPLPFSLSDNLCISLAPTIKPRELV